MAAHVEVERDCWSCGRQKPLDIHSPVLLPCLSGLELLSVKTLIFFPGSLTNGFAKPWLTVEP